MVLDAAGMMRVKLQLRVTMPMRIRAQYIPTRVHSIVLTMAAAVKDTDTLISSEADAFLQ